MVHKAFGFLVVNAMAVQLFRDGGISIFKFLLFPFMPIFVWQVLSHRLPSARNASRWKRRDETRSG
jgi:hypothetical protein